MDREYRFNCGQYVYHNEKGEPCTKPADTIALAFDKEAGVLFRHGAPDKVNEWAEAAMKRMRASGLTDWADSLVVVTGRFPLEEVNKCLSITGYVSSFYKKLQNGDIEGVGYDPDSIQAQQPEHPAP